MTNANGKKLGKVRKAKVVSPAARAMAKGREAKNSALQVLTPSSVAVTTGVPFMGNKGNGTIVVRHREFFSDVTGVADGSFSVMQFSVNPGQFGLFPWLSSVANRFEKYRFRRLEIDYQPACSVTTVGTVMAAYDTDAADAPPTSKVQLMAYQNAARSAPWGRFSAKFPMVGQGNRYTRRGGVPTNTDIKTYDVATLFVATSATAAAGQLGELYVDYEVELEVPQIQDTFLTAMLGSGLATNGADPWRTEPVITGTLSVVPIAGTGSAGRLAISLPVGVYFLMTVDFKGTAGTTISVVSTVIGGNVVTQIGTTSTTNTATSITHVSVWRVDSLAAGLTGEFAVYNGKAIMTVTAPGGTISVSSGLTCSVSPWETGLPFL